MSEEILYQIALTLVPNIGAVQARNLMEQFGNAKDIFKAKDHLLKKVTGLGDIRAHSIRIFKDFKRAEEELAFIEKYAIKPICFTQKEYPQRLLNCYDAPTLLYMKGNADLNASHIIAVIGTRSHTEYGRQLAEKMIADLTTQNIVVVSGLAYGIDAIAHRAALKNNLSTVGVLAHGLDLVYPSLHTGLAREMIQDKGGLLTEFISRTSPDKHNFPNRNRLVAGMSDATIVIETGIKGGSMITADLANGYNRDVFAFPGRTTDGQSAGCNHLIKNNKAMLLTDATELVAIMNWEEKKKPLIKRQKALFIELSTEEKQIVAILEAKESAHIDEINIRSGLSSSAVAAAILSLELQNLVVSLPGKLYRLS